MTGNSWPPGGSRLAAKLNTAGSTFLPEASGYPVVTCTASTSGMSYGSWVEVTSATGVEYYITTVGIINVAGITITGTQAVIVDVGIGAAGSEVVLGSAVALEVGSPSIFLTAGSGLGTPLRVAAGQRVAVRAATRSGATPAAQVRVTLLVTPYAAVEGN